MNTQLQRAKELFYQNKYSQAFELFQSLNENYYSGLCCLLNRDEKNAYYFWNFNRDFCPACEFGLNVLEYINLKQEKISTFFQTRAFLEIYINLFLENNLIDYCENLISCSDSLFQSNPESYKFIARALFSNGYFDMAIVFCKKSLDIFYLDPEALLILSQCYFLISDHENSKTYLDILLKHIKNYYPAILFENILNREMAKHD